MITVVSGLPRSGTSLVMQMLAAGGHPVLADDRRTADHDNPRGYFEYEKVKSLERDSSWMLDAQGKAVKIISFLLPRLPEDFEYRVIFLRRDLTEILDSQAAMLKRRGQPPGPAANTMAAYFETHLHSVQQWLSSQKRFQTLFCDYAEIIQSPAENAVRISEFLNFRLEISQMVACVDPELYRQKSGRDTFSQP